LPFCLRVVVSLTLSVICSSLYVPPRNVDNRLYMSWLSCLVDDLPPVVLVRGNQHDVLTAFM